MLDFMPLKVSRNKWKTGTNGHFLIFSHKIWQNIQVKKRCSLFEWKDKIWPKVWLEISQIASPRKFAQRLLHLRVVKKHWPLLI